MCSTLQPDFRHCYCKTLLLGSSEEGLFQCYQSPSLTPGCCISLPATNNRARAWLLWVQRNLMHIHTWLWNTGAGCIARDPEWTLEHLQQSSCAQNSPQTRKPGERSLKEWCCNSTQHKHCCKQLYSKNVLKQNKPDVHLVSHTLLLKACHKEN